MIETVLEFMRAHRPYIDAVQALSSVINLVAWIVGLGLLLAVWRRSKLQAFRFGPLEFQMQAAVDATASAARDWNSRTDGSKVDVGRIRQTIGTAFDPAVADNMTGKAVLWVDDNPANNLLAVRALKALRLDVEQVRSTAEALAALDRRHFDLIISDMGRGSDPRAGYELLENVRARDGTVPYFIFSSGDKPEYRKEAKARGAQLSTNDMIELIDVTVQVLGRG